ncbi:MAG TPA: phosphatidylglycerol lysyltransferase domain-containing protein [Rhizomicrobium sp.]|nr:phosphatidylglycerol lysyltransferase domain-containing protein [Rhizomicrobium sp.]
MNSDFEMGIDVPLIPIFPGFKRLELSDRADVERITARFPPYSDFNFTSMYSWDTHGHIFLSSLHGNLAVRFADYATMEPFYMFLGDEASNETASMLIELSEQEGLVPELRLLPEAAVKELDPLVFAVTEEHDHHDYIASLERVAAYDGRQFSRQRTAARRFEREHPAACFELLDTMCLDAQARMRRLYALWFERKHPGQALAEDHEYQAFGRCLEMPHRNLIATGFSDGAQLVAFWIGEPLPNGYVMSHYNGIFPALKQQTARVLLARGARFLNLEQDLGLPGLRSNKRMYATDGLKKCRVSRL